MNLDESAVYEVEASNVSPPTLGWVQGRAKQRGKKRRVRCSLAVGVSVVAVGALFVTNLESGEVIAASGSSDSAESAACGSQGTVEEQVQSASSCPIDVGTWQKVTDSPLSGRTNALGVSTGEEVIVFGGDPEVYCPPGADCAAPDFVSLSDGAAYSPVDQKWRAIAEAPMPIPTGTELANASDGLYVVVPNYEEGSGGVMRYTFSTDTWVKLPDLPDDQWRHLTAVDDTVIAYADSDENGERPDYIYDLETMTWQTLPEDPLSPSYDREYVYTADRLFLFAKDIVERPGSDEPNLAKVAELDLGASSWTSIGESEALYGGGVGVGDQIIFANSGSSDGGNNSWGREVPHGAIFNVSTNTWSNLPSPASEDGFEIAGAFGSNHFNAQGSVLNLDSNSWHKLPELPDAEKIFGGRTALRVGEYFFVFGGEFWETGNGGVTNDAYIVGLPTE